MLPKTRASVTLPGLVAVIGSEVVTFHYGPAVITFIVDATGARLLHISQAVAEHVRVHCAKFARALSEAKAARVLAQAARINQVAA